ncbi:MAG: DNA-directed RNA polymerase subunit alpha [Candidatus Ryanbacteria bacterium RIFCSPHIGHO2_02_FULL_45_43]|uniref:DNA-directed RNA polymerase subunit alpha n=1 Tax=Candidatus Ryanbacteria bacterium RIFCSPHIGHO2_01_45_13 TaxID=1802112 RepID=A0A1G2FZ89_9BACT|nr:MAG: DNA-directed RNA polymerase subunit alpha [Candidatus Ryanbacteria bacterium RIFCSPHIGHO2_01_FULL_44_130]OGZ42928.1 MAG: DNA-directed RNA polymerase subunit alpha [Candidatus Ryanbacteria bacterium RIFCSPHIGHO2_01_45_13]OGZ48633.1 MAG: DNA-directed RNA polymerase subunit alpha [Candidatus Ryanbacteria bacterium RIFCSPHIGHO2_02_FULL_45_43]OGZ50574.1 MAG: DNA-directed RNA polymerase subunit alpha [Candidatus Ryanbacteria bacterium RIFCSPHIGHO2_12_FULL_44_20]OGZ51880.1 MAG: DNA-directed RN
MIIMEDTILLPKHPVISEGAENEATFTIEGLHPGYGITLGNALKRVLHSSLPGAAITGVMIEKVNHEFSTLEGVLEDVLTILLNLKQVRFRMFSNNPETVSIHVSGERKLTAKDIKCSSNVEVVNPDSHIATLTESSSTFVAELTIERGVGYVSRDVLRHEKVQASVMTLDAIFTPVRKVRYEVEHMRVGTATNYDRLRLSIQTDKSITPKEAFLSAVGILKDQLKQLESFGEVDIFEQQPEVVSGEGFTKEGGSKDTEEIDAMQTRVEDLKLSSRTVNALTKANIYTVENIVGKTADELLDHEGIGEKALTEIQRAIGNLGIILKQEE